MRESGMVLNGMESRSSVEAAWSEIRFRMEVEWRQIRCRVAGSGIDVKWKRCEYYGAVPDTMEPASISLHPNPVLGPFICPPRDSRSCVARAESI